VEARPCLADGGKRTAVEFPGSMTGSARQWSSVPSWAITAIRSSVSWGTS
jgi:hypothetical protein